MNVSVFSISDGNYRFHCYILKFSSNANNIIILNRFIVFSHL